MNDESLSEKISKLISPDAGKSQPLTDVDEKFAAEYAKAVSELSPEAQLLVLRNVIRAEGWCGFANGDSMTTSSTPIEVTDIGSP